MKKLVLAVFFLGIYFSDAHANDKVSADEIKWLNRLTYGINTFTIKTYQSQGKADFLKSQLNPKNENELPADVSDLITESLENGKPIKTLVQEFKTENQRIKALPLAERPAAQQKHIQQRAEQVFALTQRHLLRALYSPAQLKEQMVWFWLNHFSVSKNKSPIVQLTLADYEERAIRPNALGKFRDLLRAILQHPTMLIYLDNSQNAANKINENYARELMELHTLGVDGGYSQQDVQELARILTGVGINWSDKRPRIKKELEPYYLAENGFEFNPARHDFGNKIFLGKPITNQGFAEVDEVLDRLVKHSATAHFISRKLAMYFVSDTPSTVLIEEMAKTFQSSDGDIAKTLQTLFNSTEFTESLGKKVSDPQHYVLATVRFVYDGQTPTNMRPLIAWLTKLGEPLYTHLTPDGYGVTEKDWMSQGQLSARFQMAKTMSSYHAKFFEEQEDSFSFSALLNLFKDSTAKKTALPKLTTPLFYQGIEPLLSEQTKAALDKANNKEEWNSLLLSAPEFFYR